MLRLATALLVLAAGTVPCLIAAEKQVTWKEVEGERGHEKRASLALDYARQRVGVVVTAYQAGDAEQATRNIALLVKAVETAQQALDDTGKVARKKPKHFKKAEIATRRLVEAIEDAQRILLVAEREALEPARVRVDEINQQLMMAIFGKKSK